MPSMAGPNAFIQNTHHCEETTSTKQSILIDAVWIASLRSQ